MTHAVCSQSKHDMKCIMEALDKMPPTLRPCLASILNSLSELARNLSPPTQSTPSGEPGLKKRLNGPVYYEHLWVDPDGFLKVDIK